MFRKISHCINPTLSRIGKRAIQCETLNQLIIDYLPEHLKTACAVGGFSNGQLLLVVKQPAMATELKYLLPTLRDKLRQQAGFYQLSGIKLQVDKEPNRTSKKNKTKQRREYSDEAREALKGTLERLRGE